MRQSTCMSCLPALALVVFTAGSGVAGAPQRQAGRPLAHAGNVRTPTLFVHGEADQRVPYEEGEQMYFALKRRGTPARMIQYAGQPHSIGGHWNNVHRMMHELEWWRTYMPPR